MEEYLNLIYKRMLLITAVFLIFAFIVDFYLACGTVIGGFFSLLQFYRFKKDLKVSKPSCGVLKYYIKLAAVFLVAFGLSKINKFLGIGFLAGVPIMQLSIMTTAFNKKIINKFMQEQPSEKKDNG